MTEQGWSKCRACARTTFEQEGALSIEAGRTTSGEEQARAFLEKYVRSRNSRKRRKAADVAVLFEEWVTYGRLQIPLQQRRLQGNLWEVKTAFLRLPYYESSDGVHRRVARMLFGFEKDSGKTPEGKIPPAYLRKGQWMIREDREC